MSCKVYLKHYDSFFSWYLRCKSSKILNVNKSYKVINIRKHIIYLLQFFRLDYVSRCTLSPYKKGD